MFYIDKSCYLFSKAYFSEPTNGRLSSTNVITVILFITIFPSLKSLASDRSKILLHVLLSRPPSPVISLQSYSLFTGSGRPVARILSVEAKGSGRWEGEEGDALFPLPSFPSFLHTPSSSSLPPPLFP